MVVVWNSSMMEMIISWIVKKYKLSPRVMFRYSSTDCVLAI